MIGLVCSFIWIRGSKHSFLTSFSNFYYYFLFLVFLRHRYLLFSSHLSRLRRTLISYPVFIPFVLRIPRCTCPPMFLEHIIHFLEVRRSWEPGTRISTGILSRSAFLCEGFSCKHPLNNHVSYHFFSSKSSNWHFLLNHCCWSGKKILLNSCWQSDDLMSLNYIGNLVTSLLLSSSDRIGM